MIKHLITIYADLYRKEEAARKFGIDMSEYLMDVYDHIEDALVDAGMDRMGGYYVDVILDHAAGELDLDVAEEILMNPAKWEKRGSSWKKVSG